MHLGGCAGGVRRVLTRIVVWWSLFTVLTGPAWSFLSLAALNCPGYRVRGSQTVM